MSKGLSPTQRTLNALRGQGLVVDIVERRFPARAGMPFGTTKDFLGIIDLIALDPVRGVVGVQSTGSDYAGHLRKLLVEQAQSTQDWLSTPGTVLELWGWRRLLVRRGGKAMTWQPRIQVITLADLGKEAS